MNLPRRLLALQFLVLASGAHAAMPVVPLPDRPAIAITRHEDAWVPVVGADGYCPVIASNGGTVTVRGGARIILTPGDRYADGSITISDVSATDVPVTTDPDIAENMPTIMDTTSEVFRATLTSSVDVAKAYVLLLSYSEDAGNPDTPPVLAVVPDKVGELKAGEPKAFSIVLPKPKSGQRPGWSVLVYVAGRQMRSTGMDAVLPRYFNRIEHIALKRRIDERIAKGADAQVSALRELPIVVPDAIRGKYRGKSIRVEIRVGTDGQVESVRTLGVSDEALTDALQRTFANWLFVPPLRNHALEQGNVIIPLRM